MFCEMLRRKKIKTWVAAAFAFAWAATNGVAVTFAGSPSKKPSSVGVEDLIRSADGAATSGDYWTALRLYRQLAEKGNARAQYTVGVMVQDRDLKEAVKWLKSAAAQGYPEAEYKLGSMYETGYGVPKDNNKSMKWYKLAAAHGYAEAEYKLGMKKRPPATSAIAAPNSQPTSPEHRRAEIAARYKACLSDAKDSYRSDWDDNCARIHEQEQNAYHACLRVHRPTQYNNDPWGCGRIYRTDTESEDCTLPILLADSLKHNLWRAQDMCSKAYESALN